MDKPQAAARLGVPEAEIAAVRDTDDGPVITSADGREYIDRAGVLAFYRVGPKNTAFPVFVPEAPAEGPAVDSDGDGVPDGTVTQILLWVGEDKDRAARALAAEQAKGDGVRATFVAKLEKLVR